MKYMKTAFVIAALVLYSSSVFAFKWNVDLDHSEVKFKINHIFTPVSGQFTDFKGEVAFDPDNLDQSKFNFIVTVNSVDTNNGKRDNHLRSKDFFDSDTFPVMTFNSSKITRITDNRYALQGQLTIKDVTKTMDLEFSYFPSKPHPIMENNLVSGFYTQFDIFRLDFHVGNGKFLKMGVVGETVNVEISMEATRKQ